MKAKFIHKRSNFFKTLIEAFVLFNLVEKSILSGSVTVLVLFLLQREFPSWFYKFLKVPSRTFLNKGSTSKIEVVIFPENHIYYLSIFQSTRQTVCQIPFPFYKFKNISVIRDLILFFYNTNQMQGRDLNF